MACNRERARSAAEASLSVVDCTTVMAFLKEAGERNDLGVGLTILHRLWNVQRGIAR